MDRTREFVSYSDLDLYPTVETEGDSLLILAYVDL